MEQKRCHIIFHLLSGPPCNLPMKSQRYTSSCDRDVACACGDRAYQLLAAASVVVASYAKVCGGMVSARIYKGCGGAMLKWGRVSNARYLTISLVEQKKAADSTHPMGIDKKNPTSCSYSGVAFGTINTPEGILSRRTQMLM